MQEWIPAKATGPIIEKWCPTRYAARTRRVYALCQDWFNATVPLDEFYSEEEEVLEVRSSVRVECHCEQNLFGFAQENQLSREFEFVASVANAIIWATLALLEDGFTDDATAMVRAVYFARQWSDYAEDFDGFPSVLIYSR